jgi:hypothetical protein
MKYYWQSAIGWPHTCITADARYCSLQFRYLTGSGHDQLNKGLLCNWWMNEWTYSYYTLVIKRACRAHVAETMSLYKHFCCCTREITNYLRNMQEEVSKLYGCKGYELNRNVSWLCQVMGFCYNCNEPWSSITAAFFDSWITYLSHVREKFCTGHLSCEICFLGKSNQTACTVSLSWLITVNHWQHRGSPSYMCLEYKKKKLAANKILLMKNMIIWVVTFCSLGSVQRFGGTYCLYLSGSIVSFVCRLLMLASCLAYSSILKIEEICSSETSGCLLFTWRCNPQYRVLLNHRLENLETNETLSM